MGLGVIFFLTLIMAAPIELSASDAVSVGPWNETARYLRESEAKEGFLPKVGGFDHFKFGDHKALE